MPTRNDEEAHDIEALARVIAARFDVAVGEAAQDIRRFAEEMTKRGYLVEI